MIIYCAEKYLVGIVFLYAIVMAFVKLMMNLKQACSSWNADCLIFI